MLTNITLGQLENAVEQLRVSTGEDCTRLLVWYDTTLERGYYSRRIEPVIGYVPRAGGGRRRGDLYLASNNPLSTTYGVYRHYFWADPRVLDALGLKEVIL